jgi:hypothetical protein
VEHSERLDCVLAPVRRQTEAPLPGHVCQGGPAFSASSPAHEIGLRHTPAKKDVTDNVRSVVFIHLRHIFAFVVPITATIRTFLARKGHSAKEVEAMRQAWFKAVTPQVALWSRPFTADACW